MDLFKPMIFGNLVGDTNWKKMDVLCGMFCYMVSNPEVFLASPHLLNLMDITAQGAGGGGHLLECVGEVMGPLMVVVGVVCFEIHPPSH